MTLDADRAQRAIAVKAGEAFERVARAQVSHDEARHVNSTPSRPNIPPWALERLWMYSWCDHICFHFVYLTAFNIETLPIHVYRRYVAWTVLAIDVSGWGPSGWC